MAEEKNWSKEFLEYMDEIVNHQNYEDIPYNMKGNGDIGWVASKKTAKGQERIQWANHIARQLGYEIKPGVYAKVMFDIHPTKMKPCQICGEEMSLSYIYLNSNLVKSFFKEFNIKLSTTDSIYDAVNLVEKKGYDLNKLKGFLIKKFKLENSVDDTFCEIIPNCELACRLGNSKLLGPGAMSNFPDRLDGFHSYNRCCRKEHDTGRHKENMKTYNKDRRAYEYWSDGNIHAANQFMGSEFFNGTTADHIGPISLGFKHDPLLLQPMSGGENAAKRDRITVEDIQKLISIESRYTNFSATSWFADIIWSKIKEHFLSTDCDTDVELYRNLLKQNMANFMKILNDIREYCGENGNEFLIKYLLLNKLDCFNYSYTFNENGEIKEKTMRNFTDASRDEFDRLVRVSFEAIADYNNKENRNIKPCFDKNDIFEIKKLLI